MCVAITGASGLLGTALQSSLRADGHRVLRYVRRREAAEAEDALYWNPDEGEIDAEGMGAAEVDVVVHLAGENIAAKRWSESFKSRLLESRRRGTALMAGALASLPEAQRPRVLISASGSGYYGDTGDQVVDESAPAGKGTLSAICVAWEEAARPAREAGIRVVHPRFGVVLSSKGGALAKMLLPFKLGVGGRLGPGSQYFPFVSLQDAVAAIRLCIDDPALEGPVNVVAPETATNDSFTRALGRALRRPTVIAVPGFALRLGLGSEMASQLLLEGQGVEPAKLRAAGFEWRHPHLEDAITAALED
jgi:uncharacterized protein (TIGR01777 family)